MKKEQKKKHNSQGKGELTKLGYVCACVCVHVCVSVYKHTCLHICKEDIIRDIIVEMSRCILTSSPSEP